MRGPQTKRHSVLLLGGLRRTLHAGDAALEALCVLLLSMTVMLTLLQVFYRYALNDALTWSEELARIFFVWTVWLGIAVVTGRRRHMKIDFLVDHLSPTALVGVDLIGRAIAAAACFALVVHGWDFAMRVTSATAALQMPSTYLYAAVPVGAALNLLYLACQRPRSRAPLWLGGVTVLAGFVVFKLFLSTIPLLPLEWGVGWTLHIVAIGLMFLDVPIAFALIIGAYAAFASQGELMMLPISQNLAASVNSFLLLSIPFFILAAQVMNASGITHHLVNFAASLVGHLRGGLAQVNIVTNTVMAGLSGSSLAVAVGTAKVLVPEMEKRGYSRAFACAVTSSASTIDNLIPPSIGLIVFAAVGSASVGALFTAGIIPGLFMAAALMCVVYWQAVRRGYERATDPATTRVRLFALRDALPALLVPIMIVGGMRAGAFTASEAGAVAILYAALVGLFAYRRFKLHDLPSIMREALIDTVAIIVIVSASAPFGWVLGIERIPQQIAASMGALAENPLLLMLVINVFLLIVGLAMEFIASLVILVPILMPIALQAGIDPVHLGIIMTMNLVIGALTPPLGVLVFATASVAKANVSEVYREVMPFLYALIAVLLVVSYVPAISLWLPRLLGY